MSLGDLALVLTMLGTLGSGALLLFRAVRKGAATREDSLTAREREHDAIIDAKLKAMDAALERTNRKYAAMVGAFTVLVDHIVTQQPHDPGVAALVDKLRQAYPVEAEMPIEFTMLLLRLDAVTGKAGKP